MYVVSCNPSYTITQCNECTLLVFPYELTGSDGNDGSRRDNNNNALGGGGA